MKIKYPIEWDERDTYERPMKGWLDHVIVETDDGRAFDLSFYDPIRLAQELKEDVARGRAGITDKGLMVIPEVTKATIEKAIRQAEAEGYFT
jgi:hypothetical protein